MPSFSLSVCSFDVTKTISRKTVEICNLNGGFTNNSSINVITHDKEKGKIVTTQKIPEKTYNNFIEVCNKFNSVYSKKLNKEEESVFEIEKASIIKACKDKKYNYIYAKIKTGDYGVESEIIDVDTGNLAFKKKKTHAEIKPFYFMILIPLQQDKKPIQRGMIIFQK